MASEVDVVAFFDERCGQGRDVFRVCWLVFHAWGLYWATHDGDQLFPARRLRASPLPRDMDNRLNPPCIWSIYARSAGDPERLSPDELQVCEVVWEEMGEWPLADIEEYTRRGACDAGGDPAQQQYMRALVRAEAGEPLPLPGATGWVAEEPARAQRCCVIRRWRVGIGFALAWVAGLVAGDVAFRPQTKNEEERP